MATQFAVAAEAMSKERESRVESSESAIMQLRMSPGGSICSSSRKRPELPPSSETVTIADRFSIHDSASSCFPTSCFNPASSVESPVPPPMATRLRPRSFGVNNANQFSFWRALSALVE